MQTLGYLQLFLHNVVGNKYKLAQIIQDTVDTSDKSDKQTLQTNLQTLEATSDYSETT